MINIFKKTLLLLTALQTVGIIFADSHEKPEQIIGITNQIGRDLKAVDSFPESGDFYGNNLRQNNLDKSNTGANSTQQFKSAKISGAFPDIFSDLYQNQTNSVDVVGKHHNTPYDNATGSNDQNSSNNQIRNQIKTEEKEDNLTNNIYPEIQQKADERQASPVPLIFDNGKNVVPGNTFSRYDESFSKSDLERRMEENSVNNKFFPFVQ